MLLRRVSSPDPVLHRIAPFGLAAAAGTCLVVDLDPAAAPLPGPSLAELLRDGATAAHLRAARRGVAVISNGGVAESEAADLIDGITAGWPAVVLRVPAGSSSIPVLPLDPPELRPARAMRAVWQAGQHGSRAPGVVLPPLRRSSVRALCRGVVEPRSRWVRAWAPVWGASWT
ncbi:MAG TPA: hypothetical protein VMS74_08480 [Acidimicrobiia bacterium]|nr:hypothetical protein [Acidimicrobiia bacterium]